MTGSLLFVSLAAAGFVALLTAAAAQFLRTLSPSVTEDRLAELVGGKKRPEALKARELLAEGAAGVNGAAARFGNRLVGFEKLLEQADRPMSPNTFFLATAGAATAGVMAAILCGAPAPLIPVGGLIGATTPLLAVLYLRKRRFKKFAAQLPDALESIARALRSGHSLASGLNVVVDELPDPISKEFRVAYEEQNMGLPLERALKNMLVRVPNIDLQFFVTAVNIQRQAGGDMGEILDQLSHLIRERFKILGQVQALTGEGRISGIVLMALPVVTFLAIYYLNPNYIEPLFTDPRGKKMIGAATVLGLVGAAAIKKIVNIKI